MTDTDRLSSAFALIDQANQEDPNQIDGVPKEYLYSQRMTEQLHEFVPDASEALQVAARAQHICRWMIPRSEYPEGRKGYHQWRRALYQFHANKTGEILEHLDYDEDFIERVQSLLRKENLRRDAEMQQLEDVICLVFLKHYFADFAANPKHDEEKLVKIVAKTWRKMSDAGH